MKNPIEKLKRTVIELMRNASLNNGKKLKTIRTKTVKLLKGNDKNIK